MRDDEEEKGKHDYIMANMGYSYKKLHLPQDDLELHGIPSKPVDSVAEGQLSPTELPSQRLPTKPFGGRTTIIAVIMAGLLLMLAIVGLVRSAVLEPRATSTATTADVPQYFQTTPELFAGETI